MSPAARISLLYFIAGAIWIATSDAILALLTQGNPDLYASIQTIKGWLYIVVTAALFYLLIKREFAARERSEQIARAQEVQFRSLFANNPLPMIIYDLETLRFLDVNNAACAYYGYTHSEFLQLTVAEIRPPEDIPRLMQSISSFSSTYKDAGQWTHLSKDGRALEVEVYMLKFIFADQPAVLSVIVDVTEQQRAEAERLEAVNLRAELSKKNEIHSLRSRFMSMVSHEFRRPLTTITSSIDLLEHYRDRMTDEAAKKHFVRIHDQLDEMKELLDDFLTLMRDEAEEKEFKPAPVDLTDLCAKMIDELKLADDQQHSIRYQTNCDSVMIEGDEKLLRHAIGNLLSNAAKYSPDGGEVRLELRRESDIEIHVSDQGIGIPAQEQAQIFEPFFRATNVGELSGSGLGLSITRQAVELHGGTIQIARSDSSGTEFMITLPINA